MFEPFFEKLGPLGVSLLFVVLVVVALAPGAWDVVGRVAVEQGGTASLLERARGSARRLVDAGRARLWDAVAGGRLWAVPSWPWG